MYKISPWYCSQDSAGQKQHSSSSWPFLSRSPLLRGSGLGLWLHVTLCLQLSAFRLDTTLFAINLKMLLMCTQQMDYLSSPDEKVDAMFMTRLCSCVQKRVFKFKKGVCIIVTLSILIFLKSNFSWKMSNIRWFPFPLFEDLKLFFFLYDS